MTIQSRTYNKVKDFVSVMKFLSELYEKTKSYENWSPIRFEDSSYNREDGVRLWEEVDETNNSTNRKLIALTARDSPRDFFLQVDPDYRYVEREMIEWIEEYFRGLNKEKRKPEKLKINILEGNIKREALLNKLGYRNEKIYGYYRIRRGNSPIPNYKCPEKFEIRSIMDSDLDQLASLIRRVFGHGEWFTAEVLEWITSCSFYRKELDIIAVTPNGIIASFCTFRIDPNSGIICLEPMGTNPDFRKLGLGKALLTEGIKRSMKYNPPFFYIDGAANTPAANRLYEVTGFTEKYAINSWVKEI
jgi:GNAT superfamily N-acetyltransferase